DPRYVTIAVPALLLLAALAASGVINYARGMGRASATLLIGGVVLLLAWTAWPQINTLRHHRPRNDHSLTAMREFGEHFRAEVRRPRLRGYREPHIHLDFPEPNPLQPEDAFLLGYFTRSAWVVAGAEGIFPRGRFYSYRDVPPNYRYVPEAGLSAAKASGRVIATHDNSVLGRYYLLEVY
ncbi:MAG TPA: hypothetical protein VHF69_04400, partial [Candidatus Synoicihabitans sp.]|nr:hypothetical protein [Candidatus Synoicihabitans sp.]